MHGCSFKSGGEQDMQCRLLHVACTHIVAVHSDDDTVDDTCLVLAYGPFSLIFFLLSGVAHCTEALCVPFLPP
eukprot:m.45430 g.45430  ORF g.45430 m.45430 type:complete len:73 (+) comp12177_c1_seq1:204-422(+)